MSVYSTNGYLVTVIGKAYEDLRHTCHADAQAYWDKFRALENEFFENIHPLVDVGLAITEVAKARGALPDLYTIHGCRHVSDLIKSLDKLAKAIGDQAAVAQPLDPLEAYILLCAAHIHDAANAIKREGHPERCDKFVREYNHLFVGPASQQVFDVASVHGGEHPEFGKDTFRTLNSDNFSLPRLPLLAALLRLGDELSENAERVPKLIEAEHPHTPASQLAFAYAKTFTSFGFEKDTLSLVYNIYPEQHSLAVNLADGSRKTFYDFLEQRINRIDLEARYCSQYARPVCSVAQIKVTIQLRAGSKPSSTRKVEAFTLNLTHGYPDIKSTVCSRSPELKVKGVAHLIECFADHPASEPIAARETPR